MKQIIIILIVTVIGLLLAIFEQNKTIETYKTAGEIHLEQEELCQSVRIDGIKQGRVCKDCLTARTKINATYWTLQMIDFNDTESLDLIRKK